MVMATVMRTVVERKTWEETKKIGRRTRKPGKSTWIFLDHLSLICTKQGKTSSLVNIHPHPHHLKGAKRLEHVADDEEDVGDAQGAEEPVEEGRHRPEC